MVLGTLAVEAVLCSSRVGQELEAELQLHLEQKTEEGIARSLSPEEERYAAIRAMDGLEQRE